MSDEIPEGMQDDARSTWPPRGLIDSFLGDSGAGAFAWRPGEVVEVDDEEARAKARAFRDVLGRYCSGVTVVTTISDGVPVGMTCQSFTSVSLDPPLVAFLPMRHSRAFAAIRRSGRFCVNFLAAGQEDISNQMASKAEDKFAGIEWRQTSQGTPLLAGTVGYTDCTVEAVHEAGDHFIVVGRVQQMDLGSTADGEAPDPLLFFQGRYRTVS